MLQLAFISTFGLSVTEKDITDILDRSRKNNRTDEITGILIADGMRFLQVLEGDRKKVQATFARIGVDKRHFAIFKLIDREAPDRDFGEWDMAYRQVQNATDEDDLVKQAGLMTSKLQDGIVRHKLRHFLHFDRQAL